MSYAGFFVRDCLGAQPGGLGGSWSASPDIVLFGLAPSADPGQLTTTEGYATDSGANAFTDAANFLYARALYTGTGAATGRAWLFWVPANIALWPQNWRSDNITVAGNPCNYQDIVATAANQVCVTSQPFVWAPPPPQEGSPYCLALWIENAPVNPPANPLASLGSFTSLDALVQFVQANPNMGWRDTADLPGGITFTQTIAVTGPAQAGSLIGVVCHNMPTDGQLGYAVPPPRPGLDAGIVPLISIGHPSMVIMSPIKNWPAGAQSSITLSYKMGATSPPPNANMTVTLVMGGFVISAQSMDFS